MGKKIFLKNKSLNPNGACNWDCYIARYPNVALLANRELVKDHWLTVDKGGPGGRICTCDEIKEIEITLRVE